MESPKNLPAAYLELARRQAYNAQIAMLAITVTIISFTVFVLFTVASPLILSYIRPDLFSEMIFASDSYGSFRLVEDIFYIQNIRERYVIFLVIIMPFIMWPLLLLPRFYRPIRYLAKKLRLRTTRDQLVIQINEAITQAVGECWLHIGTFRVMEKNDASISLSIVANGKEVYLITPLGFIRQFVSDRYSILPMLAHEAGHLFQRDVRLWVFSEAILTLGGKRVAYGIIIMLGLSGVIPFLSGSSLFEGIAKITSWEMVSRTMGPSNIVLLALLHGAAMVASGALLTRYRLYAELMADWFSVICRGVDEVYTAIERFASGDSMAGYGMRSHLGKAARLRFVKAIGTVQSASEARQLFESARLWKADKDQYDIVTVKYTRRGLKSSLKRYTSQDRDNELI